MSQGTKVESGKGQTERETLAAFASDLASDNAADWILSSPDSDGNATLTVGASMMIAPIFDLLSIICEA